MTDLAAQSDAAVGGKSGRAYAWIRERIARHEFGPGYRLVLGNIADELDMSVVPVREAIRRLEAEGLVTFERNVGARVSVIDEREYVETMQLLGVVEGYATALAAPHLTDEQFARARELNEAMRRMLDDFDAHAFTRLNQRFHAALYLPCPHTQLVDLVERGWSRLSGIRDTTFGLVPGRAHHSVQEHAHLLELVRSGADPLTIEMAARSHRLATLDAFLAARHPDAS